MLSVNNLFKIPPSTCTTLLYETTKTDPKNHLVTNLALKTLKSLLIFFAKTLDFTCDYKERTLPQKMHFVFNSLNKKKVLVTMATTLTVFIFFYKNRYSLSHPGDLRPAPSSLLERVIYNPPKRKLPNEGLFAPIYSIYLKDAQARRTRPRIWSLKAWETPVQIIFNVFAFHLTLLGLHLLQIKTRRVTKF